MRKSALPTPITFLSKELGQPCVECQAAAGVACAPGCPTGERFLRDKIRSQREALADQFDCLAKLIGELAQINRGLLQFDDAGGDEVRALAARFAGDLHTLLGKRP